MTDPADFARAERAYVTAPAGCGKTELIARAMCELRGTRQLVLTHTHAGVAALRSRLGQLGIDRRSVKIETIAGFALRYASGFPKLSGLQTDRPSGSQWAVVYGSASRVISSRVGRAVLAASYDGSFVDEYQDCVTSQHELVMELAQVMPVRLVGDPLQGIFGFAGELVDWDRDVAPNFERLPDLTKAWRWQGRNEELGEWLLAVREPLLGGTPLDLSDAPLEVRPCGQADQVSACHGVGQRAGSVVGIRQWARDAHAIAKSLGGRFTSMEEMDCADLVRAAAEMDSLTGADRAAAAIRFGMSCMTGVATPLSSARQALARGALPTAAASSAHSACVSALREVAQDDAVSNVVRALNLMRRLAGVKVYRRELLQEMLRSLKAVEDGSFASVPDAAWHMRERARRDGRRLDQRVVSRTLLIKGLEFDHVVVLKADELDARNLYVALTRGSVTLTVCTPGGTNVLTYVGAA